MGALSDRAKDVTREASNIRTGDVDALGHAFLHMVRVVEAMAREVDALREAAAERVSAER